MLSEQREPPEPTVIQKLFRKITVCNNCDNGYYHALQTALAARRSRGTNIGEPPENVVVNELMTSEFAQEITAHEHEFIVNRRNAQRDAQERAAVRLQKAAVHWLHTPTTTRPIPPMCARGMREMGIS